MFDALSIAATGMQAQQLNVDTIANNLANVNTTGFKKGRVGFTDLMVSERARLAQLNSTAQGGALGALPQLGAGVGIASMGKLFDVGDLRETDSAFDIAIRGDGFLEVVMPDGSRAFTRGGTLKVNKDGQLATQAGYALKPGIAIPDNAQSVTITADGHVQYKTSSQATAVDAGQLELVRFANPQGLIAQGDNIYRASDASGEPINGKAGDDSIGALAQGFLEGSNVKMVEETVNLMIAQRAYEASVKVAQAADEMMGMINGLRK